MKALSSLERWSDTRLPKTAAQLLNRMTFTTNKLQADFFLDSSEEPGLSTIHKRMPALKE
jgi:hypothetical protein